MKKLLYAAVAVLVLAGGYVFFTKGDKAVEEQLTAFVETHLNKPYHLEKMEQFPFIQEATLTLTSYEPEAASSLFRLVTVAPETGQTRRIEIPLASVITRGKSEHEGESFGFAHIVTRPDLSSLREHLPEEITDETFKIEHFIGYDGQVRELYLLDPLNFKDEKLDFGGVQVRVDSSVFDHSAFNMLMKAEKIQAEEDGESFVLSPFTVKMDVEKDGKYAGTSSPVSLEFPGGQVLCSEGVFSGQSKKVDGLTIALDSGKVSFNLMEIKGKGLALSLKNLEIESGMDEADDNLFDIRWGLSATPLLVTPAVLPEGTDIKKVSLRYELKGVTAGILNSLQAALVEDFDNITPAQEKLLDNIQKSNAHLVFSSVIEEAKGKGSINGTASLSEYAKGLEARKLAEIKDEKLFDFQADLRLDKTLADIFGLSPFLQMQGEHVVLKDNEFSSAVTMKDGVFKINGQILAR